VVAIGDRQRRAEFSRALDDRGANLTSGVHAAAAVAPSTRLGSGTAVFAVAVVNPDSQLGGVGR